MPTPSIGTQHRQCSAEAWQNRFRPVTPRPDQNPGTHHSIEIDLREALGEQDIPPPLQPVGYQLT